MGKKMETEVAAEVVNQLSMWDMVWSSDLITKAVMIGLIAASVWSWAIIFEKINTLRQVKRLSKTFEERFWSGGSLDKLYDSIGNPQDPDVGYVCCGNERMAPYEYYEVQNRQGAARRFFTAANRKGDDGFHGQRA